MKLLKVKLLFFKWFIWFIGELFGINVIWGLLLNGLIMLNWLIIFELINGMCSLFVILLFLLVFRGFIIVFYVVVCWRLGFIIWLMLFFLVKKVILFFLLLVVWLYNVLKLLVLFLIFFRLVVLLNLNLRFL